MEKREEEERSLLNDLKDELELKIDVFSKTRQKVRWHWSYSQLYDVDNKYSIEFEIFYVLSFADLNW